MSSVRHELNISCPARPPQSRRQRGRAGRSSGTVRAASAWLLAASSCARLLPLLRPTLTTPARDMCRRDWAGRLPSHTPRGRERAQAPRRLKSAAGARISLCVPQVACSTITRRVTRRCGQGADGARECLLISSKDPSLWIFPKGGWETDETLEEAACRETLEVVLLRCPWSWLCNLQCHDPQ